MDANRGIPRHTATDVNWAASVLRKSTPAHDDWASAITVINAWRKLHEQPMHILRVLLLQRIKIVAPGAHIATRLKRAPTIIDKVRRLPKIPLWKMQDIGGARIVAPTVAAVDSVVDSLCRIPLDGFRLRADKGVTDYIRQPKRTGYRSVHLIFEAVADPRNPDHDPTLDGLTLELQVRTALQHAWATSNEIVGTFRSETLKSDEGDPAWLEFFRLAGAVLADAEGTPRGSHVPGDAVVFDRRLSELKKELDVFETQSRYNVTTEYAERTDKTARWFVLTFKVSVRQLWIYPFGPQYFVEAVEKLEEEERQHAGNKDFDTVFVTVDQLASLKQMYPNYYADTDAFLRAVYTSEEVAEIERRSAEVRPPES